MRGRDTFQGWSPSGGSLSKQPKGWKQSRMNQPGDLQRHTHTRRHAHMHTHTHTHMHTHPHTPAVNQTAAVNQAAAFTELQVGLAWHGQCSRGCPQGLVCGVIGDAEVHTSGLPLGAHWGGSDGSKCRGSLETKSASVATQPLFEAQMGQSPGLEAAPVSWACRALLPSLLCGRKMTSNAIRMTSRTPPTTKPK